jgi:SAM-dependent methyltransferase
MPKAIEALLGRHSIYRGFRRLTGSDRVNRIFIEQYVRPRNGDAILDVGCGPADVLELIPQVRYTGIDASPNYIAAARRRFGEQAAFFCGDAASLSARGLDAFDAVICMGVMHHLSDAQVLEMLRCARDLLKAGGRFVSYDPCFTHPQHWFARWIHQRDRGEFVRFDRDYEKLIAQVFPSYRRDIRTDLCTVPATVVIFDCDAHASP